VAYFVSYENRVWRFLNAIDHSTQEEEGQEEIKEKKVPQGTVVSVEDKVNKA
jgi:hypothetical protein